MPLGKYFVIKSKLNDMVLDVKGCESDPGTEVVTWPRKDGDDNPNQTWVEDHLAGCIRTRINEDLCLTINGDNVLTVDTFTGEENQQWTMAGDRLQNRTDHQKVLDIMERREDEGSPVGAWEYNGGENQLWEFEYLDARFFHIVSEMNGKLLSCRGGKLKMHDAQEGDDDQLWHEDKHGLIYCKASGHVMSNKKGLGKKVKLEPFEAGTDYQMWTRSGNKIINRVQPSHVLDIKGQSGSEGAKVISWEYKDQSNQHWDFQYV